MNKVKLLVLTTVFIDIVGMGIVIPILPFYIKSFDSSGSVVTLLFAVYALLSFFSAPLLGKISDRIGRRPIMVISILSSAVGWIVFAYAQSITWLFIGRIIDGIAAGNISTGQSALGDIAKDEKERIANMGLVGAIFGVAFILGPIIGGLLASFSTRTPFVLVGIVSFINTLAAYIFFPETLKNKKVDYEKHTFNPFTPIITGFADVKIRLILVAWFVFGVAISIQHSMFSIFSSEVFNFGEKRVGIIFGAMGILILFNQVVLLKKVWLKISDQRKLSVYMYALFSLGMFLSSTPFLPIFFISLIISTIGQSNIRTIIMNVIASKNPEKRGEYIGIASSIMSLSMVVGPLLATISQPISIHIPFILSGLVGILGTYFVNKDRLINTKSA
jgi:DHA1 family tetracycline resistance protein-like MFS transporter